MPTEEKAGTSLLKAIMKAIPEENFLEAVNTLMLYDVDENRKRHCMGHLLVTNAGNRNLLGPHYARLDENGDGWYLTGWRHFVLREAHYYTGVYYLLAGKAYPVWPDFDREPSQGYDNKWCSICNRMMRHAVHCRKQKANVCQSCCQHCSYNHGWHCNYKEDNKKRNG